MGLTSVSSQGPGQRPDAGAEETWRRLAEAADAAGYFRAWLQLQSEAVGGVAAALLLLDDGSGTFVPASVWPASQTDVTHLGPVAQRCLKARAGQVETHAGNHFFVGYPVETAGQLLGAVVLELQPRPEAELQKALRALHWGSGRLEVVLLERRLHDFEAAQARSTLAFDLAAGVGGQARLDEAAMRLANDLSSQLGCQRVGVGVDRGGRVRLQALSGAAWFEKKSDVVTAFENAMEECLDQGRTLLWPPASGRTGAITVAQRDLAGDGAICTVPLMWQGRGIGAVTCLSQSPPDAAFVAAVEAAAALAAPTLALHRELDHWFAGRLVDKLRAFREGLADPRRPSFRVGLGAALALGLLLAFAPGEYRVSGRALVEGEVQRSLVAPFEGFIAQAQVRAGQRVRAGEVLARLDDRDLVLERQKWLAQSEQAERKYRDALAKHERAEARIYSAEWQESAAQLALAEDRLAKAQLLAPFDGVVVSGDLSQMLGSPVEKGKVLFEVAPLDAYRVILKVPEAEIRDVRPGQPGQIVLASLSDRSLPFKVKNVSVATAEEGENLFRIEAQLEQAPPGLRPGMEGVGKIVIGERRLFWIWTHSFFDWLGLKLWHWLP